MIFLAVARGQRLAVTRHRYFGIETVRRRSMHRKRGGLIDCAITGLNALPAIEIQTTILAQISYLTHADAITHRSPFANAFLRNSLELAGGRIIAATAKTRGLTTNRSATNLTAAEQ